ncbi:MAG: hypothetical protein FWG20_02895 [Candidatus Cloacimonetes bacterium]|nr:hypothetical protein [Candidatus Cloacimonadota bacterium]
MDDFNLNKATPEEKFELVEKHISQIQETFLAFGEVLSDIKRTEPFKVKGYKTLKEFLEKEYNLSSAFASKLIDTYELYVEEMALDEVDFKNIGYDRLNLIKPLVKNDEMKQARSWIEDAKTINTPDLREMVKEAREKKEKPLSMKDEFIRQYFEKMAQYLGASGKELNFRLAVYFQDADLESIKTIIKEKIKKINIKD